MNDSTWQGRTVLVTGAEGFIGSALVDELVARGARVRALCHYKPYGAAGALARYASDHRVELLAGDVRDPFVVDEAVAGVEVVFHLAALIGIPYSYVAPESYVQTNVVGSHAVVAACRRHGARMVHTSTSETYGSALRVPMDESHPAQPQSPYAASKIAADALVLSYHASFGTEVAVCRPFNTYGPRQSARAVIPAILRQLADGADEIRLGSTAPTRDFTHVSDTVAGFLTVGSSDAALGRAVNLGTGQEISIGALAELLVRVSGRDARVVVDESRLRPDASEVDRLLSDNGFARQLGWEPSTSLEDGLRDTWRWVLGSDEPGATRYVV
ncbi:SDR family NAD(P)-dependent oxidoreductase [Frigoribacterium sp. ACAM 257]|uniref:SDR family NAD(P)-dependent oxidoreductase n=1 Tax=Frigoribacterium sp. ACAM 257 TaxID=2508998 RepID=UPI0011B9C3F9|nr:SDR family NAD(P)-dependent oxidoreductase [Frigoribacterium sp. ACAM 257]TWX40003.1 SDR family NAD(P)-dependent oxidoreductase [Frigoribacterium sp. ACAM 257]